MPLPLVRSMIKCSSEASDDAPHRAVIIVASKNSVCCPKRFFQRRRRRKLCIIFIPIRGERERGRERGPPQLFFARCEPNCKFMMAVTKIYSVLSSHTEAGRERGGLHWCGGGRTVVHIHSCYYDRR